MAKKADSTDDDQSVIAFVTMVRDEIAYPAPHEAQVHPDEVKNYYSGGWIEKKDEAK
ncbi:hypothetical protein AB8884_21580 [Yersinia enterocolitica]|uniref:hypothetical protein n=1 Tax=Yersinia enterocolitica TaxID=630 RepID=UPI00285B9676|nr:hypothetical protein [Yersinia enterocolitica]HDV7153885.1 hypothetical protein [Yersinia enterocolitica]HED5569251.1 hypothetical protein [Yersinia enterocolitica]